MLGAIEEKEWDLDQ